MRTTHSKALLAALVGVLALGTADAASAQQRQGADRQQPSAQEMHRMQTQPGGWQPNKGATDQVTGVSGGGREQTGQPVETGAVRDDARQDEPGDMPKQPGRGGAADSAGHARPRARMGEEGDSVMMHTDSMPMRHTDSMPMGHTDSTTHHREGGWEEKGRFRDTSRTRPQR